MRAGMQVVEDRMGKSQQAGALALKGAQHQHQAAHGLLQEISQEPRMRAGVQAVEDRTGKSQQAGTLALKKTQQQQAAPGLQQEISQERQHCQGRQLAPASDTDN